MDIITYNEALKEKCALFNEFGRVLDFSEATIIVAENGAAMLEYVKSFEREYPEEDMTQDEADFSLTVEREVSTRDNIPVGFYYGYRQFGHNETYIRMPDLVAESIWKNRTNLLY